jgi:hypothetical protein
VARLNSNLTQILQSTYLGGSGDDMPTPLPFIPQRAMSMWRDDLSTNFPNTSGGAQANYGGGADAFVARLNSRPYPNSPIHLPGRKRWRWCRTPLPFIPQRGDVYVAGDTDSTNFPNTSGGAQASNCRIGYDAFVARLNSDLTQILQSTYLGGSGDDMPRPCHSSSTGDVYVAGRTDSTNFPNTSGGAQASFGGGYDAFVARLNSTLPKSSNPPTWEEAVTIWPRPCHSSHNGRGLCGGLYQLPPTFLTLWRGAGKQWRRLLDAFVARLNSNLTQILQSTYLGGSGGDRPTPLPFIPQRARSMWRDGPLPPTFLTLLAGRRQALWEVLL